MDARPPNGRMSARSKAALVLWGLVAVFAALAVIFVLNPWRPRSLLYPIPLVDPSFLDTATNRRGYAVLVQAKDEDALSDFDCYACHERGKPPTLRYDAASEPDHSPGALRHRDGPRGTGPEQQLLQLPRRK